MAPPVRLSPRLENRFVRLACNLPPGLQRALSERRPPIDGLTPEPDIAMLLTLMRRVGEESITRGRRDAPVERAREQTRRGALAVSGPPPPNPRFESLRVAGGDGELAARLYPAPAGGRSPAPLILFFHGGGWVIGDLDTHDSACEFIADNSGAAVLSIDYRLAPEHPFPAAIDDALAAYRWTLENASELGCDPTRIAVCGDSAGGNMAAVVSVLARDQEIPPPALQVLIYPVTDAVGGHESRRLFASGYLLSAADMAWFEGHYLQGTNADEDIRASILRAPDLTGLPPAHVVTAGLDPLRDEGELYARRLAEAGNRVSARRHPGLIHGFANLTRVSRSSREAMHELAGTIRIGLA